MDIQDSLQFGIAAPQIHPLLPVDPSGIQSYIQRAETLGFHSIWVQEQAGLKAGASAREGISMLSYAAAITQRVRLGNAVFLINLRNPIQLAKSLATLDQLSQGRLIMGVGLGAVTRLYQAYGLSPERRVARFNEALTLIRRLWTEDNLNFEGQFWQVKNASFLPKPVQKPHPPIWFGGHAPAALKRAVKYGSGFIGAGSSSNEDFREEAQTLLSALAEADKKTSDFTIGKRVYLAVDKDRERAAKRLREWFGMYYGRAEMADRVAICGNPQECAEELSKIITAGARFLLLNPVFDLMDHLEILAGEIIPQISGE